MNSIEDPIVAEVRANREAIFAKCDYDHDKFNAYMREVSERLKSEGWVFADRPVTYEAAQPESSVVREDPPDSTER